MREMKETFKPEDDAKFRQGLPDKKFEEILIALQNGEQTAANAIALDEVKATFAKILKVRSYLQDNKIFAEVICEGKEPVVVRLISTPSAKASPQNS